MCTKDVTVHILVIVVLSEATVKQGALQLMNIHRTEEEEEEEK